MIDLQTLSNIRDFIINETQNGFNTAIRNRAEELLKLFEELEFNAFQSTYITANPGAKLRLLGELQSALIANKVTSEKINETCSDKETCDDKDTSQDSDQKKEVKSDRYCNT